MNPTVVRAGFARAWIELRQKYVSAPDLVGQFSTPALYRTFPAARFGCGNGLSRPPGRCLPALTRSGGPGAVPDH